MQSRPRANFRRLAPITAFASLALLIFVLGGAATAQERHNFLAVDDTIVDAAGPYYFVAQGDSSNAFAKAGPLAEAMGLDLDFDESRRVLLFDDGSKQVELDTSNDVATGLEFRTGNLRVDGAPFGRAVPNGIVLGGDSYVAITPVVEAFGGTIGWHQEARVITVDTAAQAAGGGARLEAPRIGLHDGYTRVALDVPAQQETNVIVADGAVVLSFPGATLGAVDRSVGEGPLTRMYADQVAGEAALVLVVEHAVGADGTGYRLGRTGSGVVYVDLGPGIRGEAAGTAGPEVQASVASPSPVAAAPPLSRRQVVVIDAGHGGHDPGTLSDWAREEEIVLSVSMRLRQLLEAEGIEVILTRDHDTFLTLQERSTFATSERNIFVSIHANAASNTGAHGIETWVFGRPLDPTLIDRAIRENGGGELGAALTQEAAESADIANAIYSETQLNYSLSLANRVQNRLVSMTGARDRGVRQNLFYVIRHARIPAILVELGFVSNPDEGRRLTQDHYQQTLAQALADGIIEFLRGGGELALN